FEAESQRTLRPIEWVHLHPVRETINTGARDVRTRLREYADEIAFPSKATRRLIEQVEGPGPKGRIENDREAEGRVFVGIEGLTPAFHDALVAPADYITAVGDQARWLIVDPEACRRAGGDAWADAEARHAEKQTGKQLTYPPARHLVTVDEIGAFSAPRRIELPALELHDTTAGDRSTAGWGPGDSVARGSSRGSAG